MDYTTYDKGKALTPVEKWSKMAAMPVVGWVFLLECG